MKHLAVFSGLAAIAVSLSACGSSERTVVQPIVVAPPQVAPTALAPDGSPTVPGSTRSVEEICPNGYSNKTRSCY